MRVKIPEFDPAKTVIVRKPFSSGGRKYRHGDVFPWRNLSVAMRRVKMLYDAGYVYHKEDKEIPATTIADKAVTESVKPIQQRTVKKTVKQKIKQ